MTRYDTTKMHPLDAMQINDRALEIFRALHGQASPDIEDSLRLTVAQVLKESTQPVQVNAMLVEALEKLQRHDFEMRSKTGDGFATYVVRIIDDALTAAKQAQPERAPSDDKLNADRYRWLREQHWSDSKFAVVSNPKTAVNLGSICPSRELLDEAIDAAIKQGGNQPQPPHNQRSRNETTN